MRIFSVKLSLFTEVINFLKRDAWMRISWGGTSGALLWIIYAFGWITSLFSGAIQPNFLCSQRLLNVSLSFTGSCVIVNLRCLPYEG